jgi:hypothetical protein
MQSFQMDSKRILDLGIAEFVVSKYSHFKKNEHSLLHFFNKILPRSIAMSICNHYVAAIRKAGGLRGRLSGFRKVMG